MVNQMNNQTSGPASGSRKASQKNARPMFDTLVSADGRIKATVSGAKCMLHFPRGKPTTLHRIDGDLPTFGNAGTRATLHLDGVGRDSKLRLELPGVTLREV